MILLDFSGIAIAPIVMGQAKYDDENLIRHMILNSVRMYRQKFKDYGEMVIVADAGGNWRKDVYPEYKGKRKSNREESKIDWDRAFKNINMVLEEIKENMPWKVIHQWGCEADDAIAEITKWTQEFGNYEKVMIVSADHDFKQLQKFDNVEQFSPVTKKLVKEDNPRLYQMEHILKGCSGDGVPNVLSDDDTFLVDGKRQNVLSKKKKEALLEDPHALGEQVYRNYLRNKKMIVLTEESECPDSVKQEIINKFEQQEVPARNKVLPYLISKQARLLVEVVEEFF
jgi:energy-converting hydrogenase A subunit M